MIPRKLKDALVSEYARKMGADAYMAGGGENAVVYNHRGKDDWLTFTYSDDSDSITFTNKDSTQFDWKKQ